MRAGLTVLALSLLFGCSGDKVRLGETGGAGGLAGAGNASGAAGGGAGGASGNGGMGAFPGQKSLDLDLLFVIDNSLSQADKQQVLNRSMDELLSRLTNPRCVDSSGKPVAQPDTPDQACPTGSEREMAAVKSLHVGAISSSLGAHGGETCSATSPNFKPDQDDRARLVAPRRGIHTHENQGFFSWGSSTGPGALTSIPELVKATAALITAVGETGCGYEAPLEAMYRFLVAPNPPMIVKEEGGFTVASGTDTVLLEQRAKFLRPGSTLAVVVLTDENDCSIRDDGQSWIVTSATPGLPRATSACQVNPDDSCCTSCAAPPPAGCSPHEQDSECSKNGGNFTAPEDHVNIRCHDQKRRFGVDFLYPVERYVRGFSQSTVENRDGKAVENPLFAEIGGKQRHSSQVVLSTITGVPWQLIATQDSLAPTAPLALMTPAELIASGTWDKLVPKGNTPPTDPHMVESPLPRPGLPGPSAGLLEDPMHGHEWDVAKAFGAPQGPGDLQYACIFKLPEPRDCTSAIGGCDCVTAGPKGSSPLCQETNGAYSSIQRYGKAYPGLRQLEVTRQLADRGIVGSICPKTLEGSIRDSGFGYNPVFEPLLTRLRASLE